MLLIKEIDGLLPLVKVLRKFVAARSGQATPNVQA
jgi:hypothetical protein